MARSLRRRLSRRLPSSLRSSVQTSRCRLARSLCLLGRSLRRRLAGAFPRRSAPRSRRRRAASLAPFAGLAGGGAVPCLLGFVGEALGDRVGQRDPVLVQAGSAGFEGGLAGGESLRRIVEAGQVAVQLRQRGRERIVGPAAGSTPVRLVGHATASRARISVHANTMPCSSARTKEVALRAASRRSERGTPHASELPAGGCP